MSTRWTKSSYCDTSSCIEAAWTKTSYCDTGACVEAHIDDDVVLMRDSKDPDGPVLQFTKGQWREFIAFISA